jgi:S-DNA-T family DNA segregation ATPase FtsK/SpoIIIE
MTYFDGQPLLPPSLEERITGWLARALGLCVLAACAAGALSLLTWTASDPSLTQVTNGPTRNVLGPWGAVVADLAMQMVGLAAVFALLPPLIWSLQLASTERIAGVRVKLVMAPMAVLLLAGAFSSLPRTASWPLYHSYGGILGDLGVEFLASLLLMLNPDRAWAAAGLFYLAAGLLVLLASLGLSEPRLLPDVRAAALSRRRLEACAALGAALWRRAAQWRPWQAGAQAPWHGERITPELEFGPGPDVPSSPQAHEPATSGDTPEEEDLYTDEDDGSQAIAGRFAPFAKETRARPARVALLKTGENGAGAPEPRTYPRFSLSLLKRPPAREGAEATDGALDAEARRLHGVLEAMGAHGEVKAICRGPVLSLFEFAPRQTPPPAHLAGETEGIARAMGAAAAHVAGASSGKIEIELAHARREGVYLRELLGAEAFRAGDAVLPLALGKCANATPAFADLARMPHLLIGGAARSGKASALHAMILSLLYRLSPEECRLVLIDTKRAGFAAYQRIPHLVRPVITSVGEAVAALAGLVREVERRHGALAEAAAQSLEAFNRRRSREGAGAMGPTMPHLVVVIEELSDLVADGGQSVETTTAELAQRARRAGVHVIAATQSPAALAMELRSSFPARCAFKVPSAAESRAILRVGGAERLLGEGDMLLAAGARRPLRVHGPLLSEAEVQRVCDYLSAWRPKPTLL